MREIALDTETTGLDPTAGHRIVEIGCVELWGRIRTGKHFHVYVNPEREVPPEATRIHGITNEFLADKPTFAEVAKDFLEFLGDSPLVIHNAEFDMKFINHQLAGIGEKMIPMDRTTDTVKIARKKFPGSPANLDALCRRFNIDLEARKFHGALLDAELLSDVYLELLGGRQAGLALDAEKQSGLTTHADAPIRPAREFAIPAEDSAAHEVFVAGIKDALWKKEA